MYSRTGPREQGKRYSKGSKRPQKVRQAKQRCKHLKKKYKPLTGDAGGSLIFDINLTSLISPEGLAIPPSTPSLYTGTHCWYPEHCLIVSHQDRAIENTSGKELRSRTPSVCVLAVLSSSIVTPYWEWIAISNELVRCSDKVLLLISAEW